MNQLNVMLTGLPRSGTTLACELLNRLPDTVALDEPMEIGRRERARGGGHGAPDPDAICDEIERMVSEMRHSILTDGTAFTAHVEGEVMGAKYADDKSGGQVRTALYTRGRIRIQKPLSNQFLLIAKHPAAFTALLGTLVERFPVYAVVRNPLAILTSWQTIPFTVRDGHHQAAERIDLHLAETLGAMEDPLDRQFHLLGWFFEKYRSVLPGDRIIRYESLVESGGKSLSAITERAQALDEPLENRNSAAVYDRADMRVLGERLLRTDGPYWEFYDRDAVRALLAS